MDFYIIRWVAISLHILDLSNSLTTTSTNIAITKESIEKSDDYYYHQNLQEEDKNRTYLKHLQNVLRKNNRHESHESSFYDMLFHHNAFSKYPRTTPKPHSRAGESELYEYPSRSSYRSGNDSLEMNKRNEEIPDIQKLWNIWQQQQQNEQGPQSGFQTPNPLYNQPSYGLNSVYTHQISNNVSTAENILFPVDLFDTPPQQYFNTPQNPQQNFNILQNPQQNFNTPPNSDQYFNNPQNPQQNFNIPQNPQQNFNTPPNSDQYFNNPQNPQQNFNIPQNPQQNFNTPPNSDQYFNNPQNPQQNFNIPQNLEQNFNNPENPQQSSNIPPNPQQAFNIPQNPQQAFNFPQNPQQSFNIPQDPQQNTFIDNTEISPVATPQSEDVLDENFWGSLSPQNSHVNSGALPLSMSSMSNKGTKVDPDCARNTRWSMNCFSCRCREDRRALCTRDRNCTPPPTDKPKICKPFTEFKTDECNECKCTGDGFPICTLRYCFSYTQLSPRAPYTKQPIELARCKVGTTWRANCYDCLCDNRGRPFCLRNEDCTPPPYGIPALCKPNTIVEDTHCEVCVCNDDGIKTCMNCVPHPDHFESY